MKKLLLSLIILAGSSLGAYAQVGYDLQFFNFRLEENGVPVDTAYVGCTYDLKGAIRNNGPNGFPGVTGLTLNVYVHNDVAPIDNSSAVADYTLPGFDVPAISPNASVNISRPFFISKDYFQADTGNIIIVWPTDDYKDDNEENNYNRVNVLAPADTEHCETAGIQETNGTLSFGMYPNPANDKLNINLGRLENDGTITIMDVMGHTVYSTTVSRGEQQITLPIDADLSNGLYFVSLRIGDKVGVNKLNIRH
jgi:hypothetical protein